MLGCGARHCRVQLPAEELELGGTHVRASDSFSCKAGTGSVAVGQGFPVQLPLRNDRGSTWAPHQHCRMQHVAAGHQVKGMAIPGMGRCVAVPMHAAGIVCSPPSRHLRWHLFHPFHSLSHLPHLARTQYDDERNEVGGYGAGQAKVSVIQQMNHDGEVNRARYMPQVGGGVGNGRIQSGSTWWSSHPKFV